MRILLFSSIYKTGSVTSLPERKKGEIYLPYDQVLHNVAPSKIDMDAGTVHSQESRLCGVML